MTATKPAFQPKWKYRKHPTEGYFQPTLVTTADADAELEAEGWSDDPASTGFEVRPATQMHHSHFTGGAHLHEVVRDPTTGKPLKAQIKMNLQGDKSHAK